MKTTDVFGPLSVLNVLSRDHQMELAILAESLTPVSTNPEPNTFVSSSFGQEILPTHTFANAPDVEVLIIPGGFGTRNEVKRAPVECYIQNVFSKLKYVITICTGSAILAGIGLLDNRRATTNKSTWNTVVFLGEKVKWVRKARWVIDDTPGVTPVWSSSGVSAGIDVTFAFIKMLYGPERAESVANIMEYDRHLDHEWDPFANIWSVKVDSA
ncbi:Class I glutamine amidotransferase-like protein [Glarea lozoyensis ATCC 20868]|uniref:Class I glutamine amidotransferase-like protein n=1 Tax=Glarea lozoyensis (strain ATCC 20868 / MF5171) TaxID=1116229 RepID=S3DQZ9_GLAL2|nr:Class I glutamine amidotransferase-like protein [Glarea lozoyensis ATCC 20868]EPE34451.1 Class I glutamine amidotransferase-like protein [Glarea lozoyensis ATCC 20868]